MAVVVRVQLTVEVLTEDGHLVRILLPDDTGPIGHKPEILDRGFKIGSIQRLDIGELERYRDGSFIYDYLKSLVGRMLREVGEKAHDEMETRYSNGR